MIKVDINEGGNTEKAYITKRIRIFGLTVYMGSHTTTNTSVTKNFSKYIKVKGYETKD